MYLGLLIITGAILLILIFFFSFQFFNVMFRGFAPFVATETEVIKRLMSDLKPKDNSLIIELGCGKAGFLYAAEQNFPNTELIGIENAPFPYLMAKIQAAIRSSRIKIVRQDLYKADISRADIIYCYLNLTMMEMLASKFKFECKRHCRIISYRFPIPAFTAEKIIEFHESTKQPKFKKLARFMHKFSKKKKVAEIFRIYYYEMFF
jgi:precorrin-6B methylase 2